MPTRFNSCTVRHTGRVTVLCSEAYISQAFDPSSVPEKFTPEKLGAKKYIAIWDTGATGTVITEKVVRDCGLRPISMAMVHTASGKTITPVYFASIFLTNKVCIPQMRMTEGKIAGNADVLIGMDVISSGDFAVTNKGGKTVFSFRMPSAECIDFTKQQPSATAQTTPSPAPKVGRNEPCPCGSGKKFKKCCGK